MKSYKKFMPIFLIVLLLGSAVFSVKSKIDSENAYKTALTQARELREKGIYADSMKNYETALDEKPSVDLYYEAGEIYLIDHDYYNAPGWYKKMLSQYPKEVKTYLYGIKAYMLENRYSKAFDIYQVYQDRGLSSEDVEKEVDAFRYAYKVSGKFDEHGEFSNITGLAAVKYKDAWGYIDATGSAQIPYRYLSAGLFADYAPVIDLNGNALFIDPDANTKINETYIAETDPKFGSVKEFSLHQGTAFWAYNGTEWNAYSLENYKKLFGGYKAVQPFFGEYTAVSKDGAKWALLSSEGKEVTSFEYDEVLTDGKGACNRANAFVVRTGTQYKLVDASGKQIGKQTFTNAKGFFDNTYAAVESNGKWFFIDETGKTVLETSYEEAESFCNGYAAVKKDGKWGYINTKGELCIPCEFEAAGQFSSRGRAFVKAEGFWRLLSLISYDAE